MKSCILISGCLAMGLYWKKLRILLFVAAIGMYWLLQGLVQERQNCWHKRRHSCFKQINAKNHRKYWLSALKRMLRRI